MAKVSFWRRLGLLAAATQLLKRYRSSGDPWLRVDHPVPAPLFGPGSEHEFDWYLTGDSAVAVGDVDQLCAWLRGCEFVGDRVLFDRDDLWQHPVEFEQLRLGDCEDHALWAWRKLRELGRQTHFVTGRFYTRPSAVPDDHAWVLFDDDGGVSSLLETTVKDDRPMVIPLDQVRDQFVPHFSVDQDLNRYFYGGYLRLLLER